MSSQNKKNPPPSEEVAKAGVGQKRKANQALEGSQQPQKAEKRAKVDASGLGVSEAASSTNNNAKSNIPAT